MSDVQLSPEILASFIDGTLDRSERERVMALLANSPDDYEALLETAALADEMGTQPVRPILGARRWKYVIPALAAGILLAVFLPGRGTAPEVVTRLASAVSLDHASGRTLETRLGPTWDQPGWSVTRGIEVSLPESAVAFRLGARGVLYEVAARLSDRAAATLVSAELQGLLRSVRGGAPVAALYSLELLDDPEARAERGAALERVAEHRASFRLGAATELLRLSMGTGPSPSIPAEVPEALVGAAAALPPDQETLRSIVGDMVILLRSPQVDLDQVRQTMRAIIELAGH